jgi:hypothetical protein
MVVAGFSLRSILRKLKFAATIFYGINVKIFHCDMMENIFNTLPLIPSPQGKG